MRVLLKISGKLIDDAGLLGELAGAIGAEKDVQFALVHGGGPDISAMLARLGIESRFVGGQRVTDAQTLEVAEMVLSGKVNKTIVGALNRSGVRAVGLSGRDGELLQARPAQKFCGELGYVGEVERVNVGVLDLLTNAAIVPVISPISAGPDGRAYNVNADWAAARLAVAWRCSVLLYFSDTPGVVAKHGILPGLDPEAARRLIECGQAGAGMVPKLESAVWAVQNGVRWARILTWQGKDTLSLALRAGARIGTLIEAAAEGVRNVSRDH